MVGNNESYFGKSGKNFKSAVIFLPMIDLPPTDLTCVYSTLKLIEELAQKSSKAPVCIFEQELW